MKCSTTLHNVYISRCETRLSPIQEKAGSGLSNNYIMGCPPVRGDNPQVLASGLSYVQMDKHGITILNHLHQCIACTSRAISC